MDDSLISRAVAIAEVEEYLQGLDSCISEPDIKLDGYKNGLQVAINELKGLPAVDAVPVVRCKDCKHWHEDIDATTKWLMCHEIVTDRNWFCADGERRDEE